MDEPSWDPTWLENETLSTLKNWALLFDEVATATAKTARDLDWLDFSLIDCFSHLFKLWNRKSDTERFFFQLNRCWAKNDQIFNTLLYIINLKPFSKLSFAKFEALKSRAFTRETSFSNQMWSG